MEPSSAPARPVWIVPAIAAALALLFIVVIAVETRDHKVAAPPVATTTTTTTLPLADIPPGNPGNAFPVGTSGELAGWRLMVLSSSRAGDAVTASVQLIWDGTDDVNGPGSVAAGDPTRLVLRARDGAGKLHTLGGAACAGSAITDFTTGPPLDVGQTATASLCWTVPGLGQGPVSLQANLTSGTDQTVFALA